MDYISQLGKRARAGARRLAALDCASRGTLLFAIADALEAQTPVILSENEKDLAAAAENDMSAAMTDRLRLTAERIAEIADAVRAVVALPDPVGRVLDGGVRPNGLFITKVTVPLGVVGIIFESRPNVTVDCTALCLKSGNACILRGGKEAIHSNTALARVMRSALADEGADPDIIQLVEDTSRETATKMMQLNNYIDVLIPRGGAGLIRSVTQNATVPVIETGLGNCHIYVDADADLDMAIAVISNAKLSRPSVCNTVETLLVHREIAQLLLPPLYDEMQSSGLIWRGCPETLRILGDRKAEPASQVDWETEYNDYILAVKIVQSLEEAIDHIDAYSTRHSECILTQNLSNSTRFTREVDSAAVYINASTRFTDGGEFGLGAEIGISTQKLHARGPMGLSELVSYKYIVSGNGQIR